MFDRKRQRKDKKKKISVDFVFFIWPIRNAKQKKNIILTFSLLRFIIKKYPRK
jgi:hypothetical protein